MASFDRIIEKARERKGGVTGLSHTHISKILGYSIGENYDSEFILVETRKHEGH